MEVLVKINLLVVMVEMEAMTAAERNWLRKRNVAGGTSMHMLAVKRNRRSTCPK